MARYVALIFIFITISVSGCGKYKIPRVLRVDNTKKHNAKMARIRVFEEKRDHHSISALRVLLHDKNINIREFAADALGKIGDKKSIKHIIKAFEKYDKDIRAIQKRKFPLMHSDVSPYTTFGCALEKLTNEHFGMDSVKWCEWWKANKDRILKEKAEKE